MIQNKVQLREWLAYERRLYPIGSIIYRYLVYLRKSEYHYNLIGSSKIYHRIAYRFVNYKREKLGRLLGYEIGLNTCNRGLKIFHVGNIAIHSTARLGENCTIIGTTCLGKKGKENAPHIGNNCELGMNSVLLGEITIGNHVYVGAGAVVTKSFREDDIVLAGVPAKKIKNLPGSSSI